jgi:polyisoprenoid-binding protein YceI
MISFRAARALCTALAFFSGLGLAGANAATWNVDYGKSRLGYTIIWDGEASVALFQKWQAQIDFDPANLAASKISVTIQTASGVSDFPDYDPDRAGAQGFNAKQFPAATFTSKSIKSTGANKYEATGDLAIKGVTKSVTMPFTLTITGNSAHAVGSAAVNRGDFKVGTGSSLGIDFDSDDPVKRVATVNIDLTANKAP